MASNRRVRCAVAGAGWWATTAHIPALKAHPRADLIAIQTRDIEGAKKIARDFEIEGAFTSIDDLLAVPGLEAVIVASTPNMHYPQALAALNQGLHVLIEKPMTFTVAQASELVDLAARKNLQLLIGCPFHYTSHSIEARRLIAEGELGEVKMVSILYTNFSGGLYRGLAWDELFDGTEEVNESSNPYLVPERTSYSDPAVAGGGQIYCQVSHAAAHLGFITSLQPTEVFARFDNGGTGVDMYDTLNLQLENGALVGLCSTGATMRSKRQYEVRVYGERGMLLQELWDGKLELHTPGNPVVHYPDLAPDEIYPMYRPSQNFIDAILGEAENGSPGGLGLYAMKIIEGASRSAISKGNIVL